jgi:hypothetical protein
VTFPRVPAIVFPATSSFAADQSANIGGACERDLVHVGMGDKYCTRFAIVRDNIHGTLWQACFNTSLREGLCSQRRKFSGLQHHCVSCRQGWRNFPRSHQQWKIPRDDLPAHAHGPIALELGRKQLCPARMVIKMPGCERNIYVA